ncbi:hypothetical protein DM2_66 [Halorubrum sp. DM2]|uniref:hypothetical protein n=1 Tax=Halorubrum sp. DM2 TaxID=2527867 RepID=UPI0024B71966|nr:hypothetical protein [Halorubrum sp. DM2]VTT85184.1 hypothetical protein DM2_66 [Halorubrum sp. DM2]
MTDEERGRDAADEPETPDANDDSARPANGDPATDPTHDPQPMTDDTDRTTTATDRTTTATDRTTTASDRTATASDRAETDRDAESDGSGTDRLSTDDLRGLLDRVGLAALSLLAVVAGWGFYSQSGNAIRIWFDSAYQSVALAVFNLAVLFVALAGVTHQLRRIRADDRDGSAE